MSMQSYLRKASKKLVEDPTPPEEGENEAPVEHKSATPKAKGNAKASGGALHSAPAMHKKGTRKKI
jgi:hypothetical protein